jgi:hypothetical protein
MEAAGRDDGSGGGVEAGAPEGSEGSGDPAEDDAGAEGSLAAIVGGRDVAAGDEAEEIAAALAHGAGELSTGAGRRGGGG